MRNNRAAYRRGQHPNSRANLIPIQPGERRNPNGSNGAQRPYTDAILALSGKPLPEHLRVALNIRFRTQLNMVLRGSTDSAAAELPEKIPDIYRAGCSWAEANAVRRHMAAILEGDIGSAVEIRESVEGRATTRVEFVSQNDRLEELLAAFRNAANQSDAESQLESFPGNGKVQ
jgi:hypothetical protein